MAVWEWKNSEDLYNKFSDIKRAMQQVRVLVAARILVAEAEREVERWENLHHLVMYLEALKSHPSYSHIAAQLEGSPAFCDGTMTLEDARRSVANVVVGPPTAEQQALASAADARAAVAFRDQWMRGRAGAGGPGGGRGGVGSSGDGAAKVCHSCGGDGHIQPSCVVPDMMNRHELLATLAGRGLAAPPNLQKYKPPPGCRCAYCAAAPAAPSQACVVDVFPPDVLEQRAQVYSVRAGGGEVASFDCCASISIAGSASVLVPGSVVPLPAPVRVRWGGGHYMEATATGVMQVQGLRVPGVYLVEGFGRHCCPSSALCVSSTGG